MTEFRVAAIVLVLAIGIASLLGLRSVLAGGDVAVVPTGGDGGNRKGPVAPDGYDWRERLHMDDPSSTQPTMTFTPTPTATSTPEPTLQPPTRIGVSCKWINDGAVKATISWQNQHDGTQLNPGSLHGYNIRYEINSVPAGQYLTLEDTREFIEQVVTVYGVAGAFEGVFLINNIYTTDDEGESRYYFGPQASGVCKLDAYQMPTITNTPTITSTPTVSPTLQAKDVSVSNLSVACSRQDDDAARVSVSWDAVPASTGSGDLVGYGVNLLVSGALHTEHTVGSNELTALFTYRTILPTQSFSALVQVYPKYRNEDSVADAKGRLSSQSCLLSALVPTDPPTGTSTGTPTFTHTPASTGEAHRSDTKTPTGTPTFTHTPASTGAAHGDNAGTNTVTPTGAPSQFIAPDSLRVSCARGNPDSQLNATWLAPNTVLSDLTLNHYKVYIDVDAQSSMDVQVTATSYTQRFQILRTDATPTVSVRVRAVYTDSDSQQHQSADISGGCVFAAASGPASSAPTPTPAPTTLPPLTPPPPPWLTLDPTHAPSACRGLTVRATRPDPGAVSDLVLEPAPPNCVLPDNLIGGAELTVFLTEDVDVPLSFTAGDVNLIAGRRYEPGWIDVSATEDGRTEILLLNCHSWRVPGHVDAGVCHEAGRVSRVELDKVRLPRRPATADDPYVVSLRWAGVGGVGGGQLVGNLVMRAGVSLEDDQLGWGERLTVTATGFSPGLTVRFHALESSDRMDCDDALLDDWDEIGAVAADRRGRAVLEIRVDREFDRVGAHQVCAQDGLGAAASRSAELFLRPGLEMPGGAGASYTQGDEIVLRLLPESDDFRVESVRVDGREVRDWRQRGSELEITLPAASGDMVPIRVEFDDGGGAEVEIHLRERELLASSLEGLNEPVLLGGRMLLRAAGMGGDEVCRVYFEDIRIAILDDDDLDRDGCVRVSRQGSVELTAAVVDVDGEVTTQLVRAVMSAGDRGEITIEDDAAGRSSTMAGVAAPEVEVSIPGDVVAAGDTITVKGRNFPPDRSYLNQPEVRIDFSGRTRHVDYLEPDWEHELSLSERQQAGVLVEVFVLIDGYRLPGASARHRVEVQSARIEFDSETAGVGQKVGFKASGLPGYSAGYRLRVQGGVFLRVNGAHSFATDQYGNFEGETELPSDYQGFLLEERRTRVLIQLYQGERIIPSALASVNISADMLPTPLITPTPHIQPTPTPQPQATPMPRPTPVVIVLSTPTPTPGIIILSAPTPVATPAPVSTPVIIEGPAPTVELGDGQVAPTPIIQSGATFDVPTVEPLPTLDMPPTETIPPTLPPPPTRDPVQVARTLTAQVQAELDRENQKREEMEAERATASAEERTSDDESSRSEDALDERGSEDDGEEDDSGMFGLSSRHMVGVLLVGVLLAALGGGWYYYRRYQSQQARQNNDENADQEPGPFADFLAEQDIQGTPQAQQMQRVVVDQGPPGSDVFAGPPDEPDPPQYPSGRSDRNPGVLPSESPQAGIDLAGDDSDDWMLGEYSGGGRPTN